MTEKTIRQKITDVISIYSTNRAKLTEDQVQDIRANLSIGFYMLVEQELEPLVLKFIDLEITLDKVEAEVFDKVRKEFIEKGSSASQAIELSRKTMKADEKYIEANRNYLTCKREIEIIKDLKNSANHILNALSYRKS
jgi:hypothetical protein